MKQYQIDRIKDLMDAKGVSTTIRGISIYCLRKPMSLVR